MNFIIPKRKLFSTVSPWAVDRRPIFGTIFNHLLEKETLWQSKKMHQKQGLFLCFPPTLLFTRWPLPHSTTCKCHSNISSSLEKAHGSKGFWFCRRRRCCCRQGKRQPSQVSKTLLSFMVGKISNAEQEQCEKAQAFALGPHGTRGCCSFFL